MTKKRIGAGLLLVLVALATVAMGTRHPSHDGPNPVALAAVVEGSPSGSTSPSSQDDALVILSTLDLASFYQTLAVVRNNGGEVPQGYPPNAFVATLNPGVELALSQHPSVARIERGVADPASLTALGGQAELVAHIWNTVFRGVPDPIAAAAPSGPPPERQGPDFVIPPPEAPGVPTVPAAPTSTQTSEFMAGTIVVSVVFVESTGAGGVGNCSPPDTLFPENWDAPRQGTVLSEISAGLAFWTSRSGAPSPLTFLLGYEGLQPTSCEPITRTFEERGLWIADVLTALGFPATPGNYYTVARSFANARRTALGADWGFVIFVVDSLNDADGSFSGGRDAWGELNGPTQGLTYDNGGYGISQMHLVSLHETGHNFGALDEYASGCLTTDSWGYLNEFNASCNNGGFTGDVSVMGPYEELSRVDPPLADADVSISARGAIGWRNPGGVPAVVDVVRTATVSLTPYTPDPTSDSTPTYSASAGNTPYPVGGLNTVTIEGIPYYRSPSPVTVSRVAAAQWNLDGGPFIIAGVVPTDGAFDQESELYTFTPPSPVADGTHIFRTRSTNNFGHISSVATDTLTIAAGPDSDGDGYTDAAEGYLGTDPLDDCPDNTSDPAWPLDQDNNGQILIPDVTKYTGKLFTPVTCPSADPNCRLDLDLNGQILIPDVTQYTGKLFLACVQ